MQIIVPFRYEMPDVIVLVAEYAFDKPTVRKAVMCHRPCTPFTIFVLLGLEDWCERDYHCGVFFSMVFVACITRMLIYFEYQRHQK